MATVDDAQRTGQSDGGWRSPRLAPRRRLSQSLARPRQDREEDEQRREGDDIAEVDRDGSGPRTTLDDRHDDTEDPDAHDARHADSPHPPQRRQRLPLSGIRDGLPEGVDRVLTRRSDMRLDLRDDLTHLGLIDAVDAEPVPREPWL